MICRICFTVIDKNIVCNVHNYTEWLKRNLINIYINDIARFSNQPFTDLESLLEFSLFTTILGLLLRWFLDSGGEICASFFVFSLLLLLGGSLCFLDMASFECARFPSMEIIFSEYPQLSFIKYVMVGKSFSSRLL